jgi:hypothetical protein
MSPAQPPPFLLHALKESGNMNKQNKKELKMEWLNSRTLVFEDEYDLFLKRKNSNGTIKYEKYGTKRELYIAREGKDLYELTSNSGRYIMNPLCWSCEYCILFFRDWVYPSCLLGKDCGYVSFCRDFKPGEYFGYDEDRDMGERRKAAEKVLKNIVWRRCHYCKYRNKEKTEKVVKEKENIPADIEDVFEIIDKGEISYLYFDYSEMFCELSKREFEIEEGKTCKAFRVSKEERKSYESHKRGLRNYIYKLKRLEKSRTP